MAVPLGAESLTIRLQTSSPGMVRPMKLAALTRLFGRQRI
jgi:hypothetical protein